MCKNVWYWNSIIHTLHQLLAKNAFVNLTSSWMFLIKCNLHQIMQLNTMHYLWCCRNDTVIGIDLKLQISILNHFKLNIVSRQIKVSKRPQGQESKKLKKRSVMASTSSWLIKLWTIGSTQRWDLNMQPYNHKNRVQRKACR